MAKSKHKRTPKTVLKLPDLEQWRSAVVNSLTSASSKRPYDYAIRENSSTGTAQSRDSPSTGRWSHDIGLPSNSTHTPRRRSTSGWQRYAEWRMKGPIADSSVLTSRQAYVA